MIISQNCDQRQIALWFLNPFPKLENESDEAAEARRNLKADELLVELQEVVKKQQLTTLDEKIIVHDKYSVLQDEEILNLTKRTANVSKYNLTE